MSPSAAARGFTCVCLVAPHPTCGVVHATKSAAAKHRIFRRSGKRVEAAMIPPAAQGKGIAMARISHVDPMATVLVCGDRHWYDGTMILERLRTMPRATAVITGGAPGADTLAHETAIFLGMPTVVVTADWDGQGQVARNRAMLDLRPDRVIAFHDDLRRSKGTADCIAEANRRGIPTEVHGHVTAARLARGRS